MHNSIRTLLEEVGDKTSKRRNAVEQTTALILGFTNRIEEETLLIQQIRSIKKYVNEIIISVPFGYEIQHSGLKNEILDLKIKVIEREEQLHSETNLVLDILVKRSINDMILFFPYNLELSQIKIKNLLMFSPSLASFLGSLGNFCPSFGLLNKWSNRFNMQILRFHERENLEDLYRINTNLLFLKLIKQDKIQRKKLTSNDLFESIKSKESESYFPQRIQYSIDEQALVKMIALMHMLSREIKEKQMVSSSFKIQQLLTISQKFANSGHSFLSFQAVLFILRNSNYDMQFPLDWSLQKVREYGRKLLLDESKFHADKGFERLRMACLKDMLLYDLVKESDVTWIKEEIKKIEVVLKTDNIDHQEFK